MLFRSNREPNYYLYLSLYAIFFSILAFLELQVEKSSLTNSHFIKFCLVIFDQHSEYTKIPIKGYFESEIFHVCTSSTLENSFNVF